MPLSFRRNGEVVSEFAPEYSRRERLVLLARTLAWALPLFALTKFGFLPWFARYTDNARCLEYGQVTRSELVFHGVFVGLPLLVAILLLLFEGRDAVRTIRLGQHPLPGQKVFRRTRYTYGLRAKLKACLVFALVACCIGLAAGGAVSARQAGKAVKPDGLPRCDASQPGARRLQR